MAHAPPTGATARARRSRPAALLAAFALALLAGAWWGWQRAQAPPDLSRWDARIRAAARDAGLDPSLLLALVAAESGGRERATSAKGARGLLQVVPGTAREEAERLGLGDLDDEALYEPETNLRIGASYLARLLDRFGREEAFAVAAYNAGPTPVERWRRRAPGASAMDVIRTEGYEETRRHVEKVLRWRGHYR
jgi:soluble lytic murein transglycosylase